MRQETLYTILRNCKQEDNNRWQELFTREVVGTTVLTAYNNKTYRVDDVDFRATPSDTFEQRGEQISFVSYYQTKYNLQIVDPRQPMLVSNPKARDIRGGRGDMKILLVPELCRSTGLTDRMRSNFTMMREMAQHTQMDPERRKARIKTLTERIYNTPASATQLTRFDMEINRDIVKFDGRALPQETMIYGNGAT